MTMKKTVCGCVIVVLALATKASAQLVAGSPEDALFQQITAAGSAGDKIALANQFTSEFPDAHESIMVPLYTVLMTAHEQQQDHREALGYAEQVVALDPDNVNAYMALCRYLSVNLVEDLDQAVEYGERALSLAEALAAQEPPPNYTPESWQAYTRQTEDYARSILSYARTIR
jgi:tetratricopeptide (TPR) repeat protein